MNWDLKLTQATDDVVEFIQESGYPFEWTRQDLVDLSILFKAVTKANQIIGYFWFASVPDTYKIFDLNISIAPKFHKIWYTKKCFHKLKAVAELIDADTVLIHHPQNIDRLKHLYRFGFEVYPPFAIFKMKEKEHGKRT